MNDAWFSRTYRFFSGAYWLKIFTILVWKFSRQAELDSGCYVGTILMNLSKAYDCLSHDLLIAKLEAYGFDIDSLNFLLDYLSLRKQRTKVGSSYNKWFEICRGIPQGSILRLLLFNIFMNNIFFFIEKSENCNFCNLVT